MIPKFLSRLLNGAATRDRFAASAITDGNFNRGLDWNAVYRDRYHYQRENVLKESLLAWRLNPLARRLVTLMRQYVVDGIDFHCDHEDTAAFLREFWTHPLNRIGQHLAEWSDELMLTGNLFPILTTDSAGMTYIRIMPTDQVKEIHTAANDLQQEQGYTPKGSLADPDPKAIPNYYARRNRKTVMLHYAVNKLAGMEWGEPDIAPLLPWLGRYALWLEDRVRLNRFRQAFMYVVKGRWMSQAEKDARARELNSSPPNPGSILLTDEQEQWDVLSPKLESHEAGSDGLALKKLIAGGFGIPLHWLAEPESSTRTTAEAAGTPTFKTLEERQQLFLAIVQEILTVAVARRAAKGDTTVDPRARIFVTAGDVSERDNAALALAATQVITSFGQLWAANLISADEYLRVVYRFAGETLPAGRPDNPKPMVQPAGAARPRGIHVDAETGKVKVQS
jgi:hypothetical protein